jgi:hypothetical protein
MFFRTKFIKGSRLVQLIHSYRNSDGLPRQTLIASLGDAAIPEPEKALIASAIERRIRTPNMASVSYRAVLDGGRL